MNERLVDDLELKARAIAVSDTKDGGKRFDLDLFHRKFAELIVRECIEVVKWTPSQFPNDEYVKNIQEHFGVKE